MTDEIVLEDMDWNEDIFEDTASPDLESLVVYSRDWTVETIYSQIQSGNIDLNPKFQRRNAWSDTRRSRLIESLIIGIPVPEIVLAEEPNKKKSFIVIDGKQRLLSIAGFINPTKIDYWDRSILKNLTVREDLIGKTFEDISESEEFENEKRAFLNADVRTTVITNYKSNDVLYDIFYRLNTGSVSLSTQELRQVLNKGPFADYLIEVTSKLQPIHNVLNLKDSDRRLRDAEIILRSLSFDFFGSEYKGNLKNFLDDSMSKITKQWEDYEGKVREYYEKFNETINILVDLFPKNKIGNTRVGRKFVDGEWEGRFNKVLFEVEAYYFMRLRDKKLSKTQKQKFIKEFRKLSDENIDFRNSIESSTKDMKPYESRFLLFRNLVNDTFGTKIKDIPVKQ